MDIAPDSQWHGVRFNCQAQDQTTYLWSNLQTFMIVNGQLAGSKAGSKAQPPKLNWKPFKVDWRRVLKASRDLIEAFRRKK